MKQVSFLSHIIFEEGITMDSSKIQDMLTWNTFAGVTDIWSFLRTSGILSEVHQRILKDQRTHDQVAWEGQEVQLDSRP
jgi:uncharacterized membrane protein YjfL (UPF0719 family)